MNLIKFEEDQIKSWKENYINFKKIISILISSYKHDQTSQVEYSLSYSSVYIANSQDLTDNYNENNSMSNSSTTITSQGKSVGCNNEFNHSYHILKNHLSSEIKRVYQFYSSIERELYIQINIRIQVKDLYNTLSLMSIVDELRKLKEISWILYNLTKFVNQNLVLVKEILGFIENSYLKDRIKSYLYNQITCINSDLNYLLQFKIIDEVSCILNEFSSVLYMIILDKSSQTNKSTSSNLSTSLLINNEENQTDTINEAHSLIKTIKQNVSYIDIVSMEYRIQFDSNEISVYDSKAVINNVKFVKEKAKFSFLFICNENTFRKEVLMIDEVKGNEYLIKKMRKEKEKEMERDSKESKENQYYIGSNEYINNIYLIFLYTSLYIIVYSLPVLVLFSNLTTTDVEQSPSPYEIIFLMAVTPLFTSISNIFSSKIRKNHIKTTLLLSTFTLLSSLILLIISNQTDNNVNLIIVSRILTGLCYIKTINREYIIKYSPYSSRKSLLKKHQFMNILSLLFGFLLYFLILTVIHKDYPMSLRILDYNLKFNFNRVSILYMIVSFFIITTLLLISLLFKQNPNQNKEEKEENQTKSNKSSQSITSNTTNNSTTLTFLSRSESRLVSKINKRLNLLNNKENFTTTNYLKRELKRISDEELFLKKTLHKGFILLVNLYINVNFLFEFIVLYCSFFVFHSYLTDDYSVSCLVLIVSFVLVLPLYRFEINTYNTRILSSCIGIIMVLIGFLSVVLLVKWKLVVVICIPFLVLISSYLNLYLNKLILQNIPYSFMFLGFFPGDVLQISDSINKATGFILFSILTYLLSFEQASLTCFFLIFIRFALCFVDLTLNEECIRVRSLTRIVELECMTDD